MYALNIIHILTCFPSYNEIRAHSYISTLYFCISLSIYIYTHVHAHTPVLCLQK